MAIIINGVDIEARIAGLEAEVALLRAENTELQLELAEARSFGLDDQY